MKPSDAKTRSDQCFINPWRRYVGSFIPNWLLCRHEVSAQAKLCYARLAQYAGQKGVAYPKQDTLARELGVDTRTVRRYVAELREHDLVFVEDRRNKNFQNKYKFLDHPWQYEGDVIDDEDESNSKPSKHHRTDLSCKKGGPRDKVVLTPQDKVVLSRRESLRRDSQVKENHTAGRLPGAGRAPHAGRDRKPPKPPPAPKTFEDEKDPGSLGSESEEGASGEEEESRPISAARPKTQKPIVARRTAAQKAAQAGARKASAQVSANAEKRMKAAAVNEQRAKNLASKGPKGPGVRSVERLWMDLMEEHLPSLTIAKWAAKERGQVKQLLDKYSVQIVSDALRYVVENWSGINTRIFKDRASHPTVGMVLKLHDSLVIEAQKWSQHRMTISEWEAWSKENPYSLDPPGDLDERYQQAMKELEGLGIGAS